MASRQAFRLLKSAGSQWNDHNAPRLGAALAYYTLLSLAPLLVLLVAVCGLVFSKTTAESDLITLVRKVAGYAEAQTLKSFIDNAHQAGTGIAATVIALVTLLFGASGVFVELRDSMNAIWDVPAPQTSSWRSMVVQRLISFVMVLALGVLVLGSLILTAGLGVVQQVFAGVLPLHSAVIEEVGNHAISVVSLAFLFGLIFKFVP
jgi:membrane protein